ncbi:MAG TPA: helix-turn-helix transcriptional regulator [Sporosarcina psychrophila]|uniref:Helix-turn-helix transcriptional regulator n=1 Tax=Sporosarcina psychrophila TaxID=1476 RepID=A0A921FZ04_SPOPS|nr:helix-turn-helix transcriptional regulator [Sporosarcina psychrophila]
MREDISYTTEEIAQILKVSKLTVYDLIKKEELPSYRVGRQIRVDAHDLSAYKERAKSGRNIKRVDTHRPENPSFESKSSTTTRQIIISGQDLSLDILANYIEKNSNGYRPLRSYTGSLNSLVSMYQEEADVVSTHLFDGDTGEYNVPYIRKILVGQPYLIVNFLSRWEGFYVRKGNPKNIQSWTDLTKPGITMINREKGSGVRVLIDEKFRVEGISPYRVNGYESEELNHIGVASKVAGGDADVGIGIEKAARLVDVDFIPLIEERYDLVILKTEQNEGLIDLLTRILQSDSFQKEIKSIGGYDLSQTGNVIYETF